MTRYSRRFAVTLVVAFVGVLAACGDDSAEPAADEPAADGTDSVEGARLVVAFPFEINSTDPRSGLGQNELLPHIHVFDSLLRIAPDGRSLQPRLATDWTITDDPTVWRFSLREDVSFSDGAALDANAVKLSFDRLFDQDAIVPDRDILVNITGVEVVDDMTVEISTSEPNAAIPYAVASPLTSIVSPQTIESFGDDLGNQLPAGTGPFMFASTNFPDSVVLERNPTSWDPAQGNVEELEFVGIRDTSARLNALLSGEADINLYVDLRDVPRLESAGGYRTEVVSSTRQFTLHLPMNLDVMQDLNVRRALNHAVDRDQIVETVYSGAAFPAVTVFGPGQGGHEDLGQLEYDPDLSLDLWAEAGWVPGSAGVLENSETGEPFPTVVLTASDGRYPQDAAHAEAVGGYLTEIGVPIELRIEGDFGTYFDSIINEAAEQNWIAQMPWGSYDGDGAESLCPMYLSDQENNLGGYENPALGQICDDISSSFDLEQRDALIAQGAALVYADLPAIYTLSPSYIVGLRDDTEDLVIVSFELHDFSDARVAG